MTRALCAAVVLALVVCACGSSRHADTGRTLFTQACGSCHSLTGHDAPAKQGGDLLDLHLPRVVALQFAREMPVPHPLSRSQLATIVDYIASVQRR